MTDERACPHCGASVPPVADAFCPSCREELSAPAAHPVASAVAEVRPRGWGYPIQWVAAVCSGLVTAAVLWAFGQCAVGVACWFAFGKDEVPSGAEAAAIAVPVLIALLGGILAGRIAFKAAGPMR